MFQIRKAALGQPFHLAIDPIFVLLPDLRRQLCSTLSINADELPLAPLVFELNKPFDQSEEGIVLAAADVAARLPFRAALASQNVAAEDVLAAEFLQTKPLRVRVAAVT